MFQQAQLFTFYNFIIFSSTQIKQIFAGEKP